MSEQMRLHSLVRCGICTALMGVCAWVALPFGELAVTMQSFAVFLTLCLLGGRKGTAAFFAYLLLGAVGLPVFSGFRGGFGVLLGPSGGYLWGFGLACLLYWLLEGRLPNWLLLSMGQLLCYLCGTLWYLWTYAPGGIWPALLICVVPYLLPDTLKLGLVLTVAGRIKNRV